MSMSEKLKKPLDFNTAFIIGTAGSGKSVLTGAFQLYLQKQQASVATINLDPAVKSLPYEPDIDVRNYIDIDKLAEELQLGPNGSLIAAVDLISRDEIFDHIVEELEDFEGYDALLVDTPGQMEIFAYRIAGPKIVQRFNSNTSALIFLFDAALAENISGFLSLELLATSVIFRLNLPIVNVLTKIDILKPEVVRSILSWSESVDNVADAIDLEVGLIRELGKEMMTLIENLQSYYPLIPVSAYHHVGLDQLAAAMSRVWTGAEDWL